MDFDLDLDLDPILREFQNDVEEINFFEGLTRRRKVYRKRVNPLRDLTEEEFRRRYRFSKANMCRIIDIVRADLQVDTRGSGIPAELQVMAVVTYWGRHEVQEDCAEIHGMSQQTLSRLARKVAIALASKSSRYIKMPSTKIEQTNAIKKFEAISGLPGIIGAIACTHIKLRKIGDDSQYNNSRESSFNIQVVCDADLMICDIVCYSKESIPNEVYKDSSIKRRFDENEYMGKLIGDSGYASTAHIMTPVLRPNTEKERHYNQQHVQTHNVAHKFLSIWKQRFEVLLDVMRGGHATIKTTVVACAVLHNLAILFNEHDTAELPCEEGH